jgi:hypothetical protein
LDSYFRIAVQFEQHQNSPVTLFRDLAPKRPTEEAPMEDAPMDARSSTQQPSNPAVQIRRRAVYEPNIDLQDNQDNE